MCTKLYYDTNTFVKSVTKVHNNFYDYSLTQYISPSVKVNILCPIHGIFQILPYNHYKGAGCSSCGILKAAESKKYTTPLFISKANTTHDHKYNYDLTEYVSSSSKVIITCPDHGNFEQLPAEHLRGAGCIKCFYKSQQSKIERDLINFFENTLMLTCLSSYRPAWLGKKELDIFIPSLNLAIEVNGIVYHHSSNGLSPFYDKTYKEPDYHLNKFNICKENGVKLIHIFDFEDLDEWKNILTINLKNPFSVTFENVVRIVGNFEIYGKSGVLRN